MRSCRAFTRLFAFALPVACTALLAGCDGPTGGYPPPPPPYEAPAAALEMAKTPKFRPLVKALMAQRAASRGDFSGLERTTDAEGNRLSTFAASRAAADALTKSVRDAGLSAEEQATWRTISALDDAALESLLQPN